jgi:dihydrolipoamide dehydrogenase
VEFATIYRAYGAEITILEMLPHLLPKEDEEVSVEFEKQMQRSGIKFKTNARVERAERKDGQINLHMTTPQGAEIVPAQKVLVAVGVQPNSDNMGLEALGVNMDRGAIVVDDNMQTSVPGIYAIGDVTMKLALAHVASAQGIIAVEAIADKHPRPLNLNSVPRCTYSHPQVASLGLTEIQARETGREMSVGKFPFRANGKALALNDYEGFVKIIADKKYGEILGVHMIGPEVTDLTGELSLAKSMELTPNEIANAVHAHPTLTEVVAEAALATMGQAIHI